MRKTDVLKFKKLFVEQREQLMSQMVMIDETLAIQADDKDEVDQANAGIQQNLRMQMKNREQVQLRTLSEAIRRIDEGSFGECQSCGCDIELKRLQARPTASLCIACKEEEEKLAAATALTARYLVH